MKIRIYTHNGPISERIYVYPRWSLVEEEIGKLGYKHKTLLLEPRENYFLVISGGQSGVYIIGAEYPYGWKNLYNEKLSSLKFPLAACGRFAQYPGSNCADLESTLKIAKTFHGRSILDPDFKWIHCTQEADGTLLARPRSL